VPMPGSETTIQRTVLGIGTRKAGGGGGRGGQGKAKARKEESGMIPWWWLVVVAVLSASGGLLLGAICMVAGEADRKAEEMEKPKRAA
jgi:hypothetical protein